MFRGLVEMFTAICFSGIVYIYYFIVLMHCIADYYIFIYPSNFIYIKIF